MSSEGPAEVIIDLARAAPAADGEKKEPAEKKEGAEVLSTALLDENGKLVLDENGEPVRANNGKKAKRKKDWFVARARARLG